MQARRFLQFAALVCVVISSKAFWSWSAPSAKREIKTPVILVPGTAGSQLEAKLDRPSVAHWYCSRKTSHFFTIWVKVFLLLPFAVNCWDDNMRLLFDEKTNKLKNVPGVEIRVPGFGETYTVEYLDDEKVISYFASMVERMVSWGYERGVSVRAAPYDYRYGPESQDEFYKKMKRLIEETYSANGNKRITLMTHSMGGPLTLVFLNRQTSDWKDKYLHQWIAMSAPFGGAVEEIRTYTSGNTLFVPHFILNPLAVRREQRTDTSNIFMLPSPELWSPDEVLLQTPHRTYTVNDYDQLFEDIGFPLGKKLRRLVGNLTYPLSAHAPNITVHCLHGSGIQTAERLTFSRGEDLHNTQPEVSYGDGDSLVNIRSLEACEKWSQRQAYPVILKQFPSVYHNAILVDEDAQNYVKNLLFY